MAIKPEPLFPTIAACPNCGKRTRVKMEQSFPVPRGVDGVGYLRCFPCNKRYFRTVGTAEGIAAFALALAIESHGHSPEEELTHHHDPLTIVGQTDKYAFIDITPAPGH